MRKGNIYAYLCWAMKNEQKPSVGRPTKDPERIKRGHSLSFTDAEYERLGELARAAKLGRSEYIIEALGLNKK